MDPGEGAGVPKRIANVQQAEAWDGAEGDDWARDWQRFDRSLRGYHRRMLETAAIPPTDHVLDVGCGNGESTRDAARAASRGHALGVDLSSKMLARARALARAEGLANVRFEQADAQVHPFEADAYDVVVSRFGAMFFADPVAAFGNIRRAMRPGGRLVTVAWQPLDRNTWLRELRGALAVGRELPAPPVSEPGPFGLADPAAVRSILTRAGFEAVDVAGVEEPWRAGDHAEDAFEFVTRLPIARGFLGDLDDAGKAQALAALRASMVAHDTGDGVLFGSAAWLITARRTPLSSPPCRS
jgi:SAM-dependent methyltransferase